MEFENTNNINLAIEAELRKTTPSKIFKSATRYIKKLLRKARRSHCNCTSVQQTEEEIDNNLNEQLEAKLSMMTYEADLRNFNHITYRQTPSAQVPFY